jgi:biopolymer transport protein ExbD
MPKLEPMANSVGRSGHRRARAARVSSSLAEINVVPLVDVMLVLLVIFMVAAPMMQRDFPSTFESSQSRG